MIAGTHLDLRARTVFSLLFCGMAAFALIATTLPVHAQSDTHRAKKKKAVRAPNQDPLPQQIAWLETLPMTPFAFEGSLEDYAASIGVSKPSYDASPWNALYWRDGEVELTPLKGLRETPTPFDRRHLERHMRHAVPDVKEPPLMFVRARYEGQDQHQPAPNFTTGKIPGVVMDEVLREGWSREFKLGTRSWTLRALYAKGLNARILPGSMQLLMFSSSNTDHSIIVLDRAPGHIFKEQRVMWAGDINGDTMPDFYIRRTLITGEVDHVLTASSVTFQYRANGVTVDPDHGIKGFSSGVEDSGDNAWRQANSPRPYAEIVVAEMQAEPTSYAMSGLRPVNGLAIHEERTADSGQPDAKPLLAPVTDLPPVSALKFGVTRDLSFTFDGATYRVVVEIIPTYGGSANAPQYATQTAFGSYAGGETSLQISLHHHGKRQVLLVTSPMLDGGNMNLTAGDLDGSGKLSIEIDYYPHYNNAMRHRWRRVDDLNRIVKRTLSFQSQGC